MPWQCNATTIVVAHARLEIGVLCGLLLPKVRSRRPDLGSRSPSPIAMMTGLHLDTGGFEARVAVDDLVASFTAPLHNGPTGLGRRRTTRQPSFSSPLPIAPS